MFGTKEIKEALSFLFGLFTAIFESLEDNGKIDLADIGNFAPLLLKILPAIEGADLLDDELLDMTVEEETELKAWLAAEFNLSDDELETVIERGFNLFVDILGFVNDFIRPAFLRK